MIAFRNVMLVQIGAGLHVAEFIGAFAWQAWDNVQA